MKIDNADCIIMYTFSVVREPKWGIPPHCWGFRIRDN